MNTLLCFFGNYNIFGYSAIGMDKTYVKAHLRKSQALSRLQRSREALLAAEEGLRRSECKGKSDAGVHQELCALVRELGVSPPTAHRKGGVVSESGKVLGQDILSELAQRSKVDDINVHEYASVDLDGMD